MTVAAERTSVLGRRSRRGASGSTLRGGAESYERNLHAEPRWAMEEGGLHFEGESKVHQTLRRVVRRLDELGIPYAVSGGMALFGHGYRRFTEDVDILVIPADLRRIHQELEGRGYLPPFARSKNLRDTETKVRIEFLQSGQFPGDGKPKPVAFPDPAAVSTEIDGVRYLNLPTLVELKLASGMTSPDRRRDLADVAELIRTLHLPRGFAADLAEYVRGQYDQLWVEQHGVTKRYLRLWRNKFLTLDAVTIDDMVDALRAAADELAAMRADGVVLDPQGGTGDDYAHLVTSDPDVARRHDMHEESEFLGLDDDGGGTDDEGAGGGGTLD